MFYFIVWVGLCFLVAMIGTNKNVGYWGTFFISLFFSPLIGGIVALISSETQAPIKVYTCKHCGLQSKVNSHFCPACEKDDHGKKKEDYTQKE
jgi:phosphate/sulfate permease